MPRIIVTTDLSSPSDGLPVLLDEQVRSLHLSSDHAAAQLIERLAWAISDAEDAEGSEAPVSLTRPSASPRGAASPSARGPRRRRAVLSSRAPARAGAR